MDEINIQTNRELKLSNRMQKIVSLIEKTDVVADVGTDHGYIPNYLIENGIAKLVYATDISADSLGKNIEFSKLRGNSDSIISRVGDGLKPIENEKINTVIIAGMGGILISQIIENSIEFARGIEYFILQPMTASYELRYYLYQNDFNILREEIVEDNDKIYEIMYVKNGEKDLKSPVFLRYGENLIKEKNDVLIKLLTRNIESNKNIMSQIIKNSEGKTNSRVFELEEDIKRDEELLNEIES
ncbi:MAG: SAM-dependent methyltransferase [Tissierellia bacterium]|nr:SAM-dependent methyltransferase [Tissierellia bacterium]